MDGGFVVAAAKRSQAVHPFLHGLRDTSVRSAAVASGSANAEAAGLDRDERRARRVAGRDSGRQRADPRRVLGHEAHRQRDGLAAALGGAPDVLLELVVAERAT